jgi:CBS domain-containing protein
MLAKDVMTTPVVTIAPDMPLRDTVALLLERRISGVPVVADGRVVGMVSEHDLLRRPELGTDGIAFERPWWVRLLEGESFPADYVRSHAGRARDFMTRPVISVVEDTPLRTLAAIFVRRHIRRVPVLRGERLVGIVSRADLVRALARVVQAPPAPNGGDEAMRLRLLHELQQQRWWRSDWSTVDVRDGIVHYRGLVEGEAERRAARVAAENVPGVRAVHDDRMQAEAWVPLI